MNLKAWWFCIFLFISSLAIGQTYPYNNEWIDFSKTYYKCKVMGFGLDEVNVPIRKGLVRIPFSTLAAAGLGATASEHFQLWRDGEEVPIFVSASSGTLANSDYLEFFGEINNGKLDRQMYRDPDFQLSDKWSLQTDTAAYFLTVNTASANKRLVTVNNNVANNTLPATPYFMNTVGRYFRSALSNGFSASLNKSLYSSSYDRGEGWVSRAVRPVAGCGSATLPQNFFNLYPYLAGPKMTMRVNAIGDLQNSRVVQIKLNTEVVTTFQMDYINYVKSTAALNVSKISTGTANFEIVNKSRNGCDEMRVAMVELTYPRVFNMGGASIFNFPLERSSKGHYLEITNFKHTGVPPVLYDLASGKRYVGNISNPDTIKIVLAPSDVDYNLVLTTSSGAYYKEITNIETRKFTDFSTVDKQGDYLIISNPLIYGSGSENYVEQYQQYRSSQQGGSFNAKIIDINELVDQFAWGIKKHPLSIKNFLRFARENFAAAPKNVFLIGKGVVYNEYRSNESNSLADRLNLVPTWGNPASDNLLASADLTALPATPIGRLSAVTPREIGDYLLKVKQHDSTKVDTTQTIEAKGWMKNVIQIEGANDIGLGNQLDAYLNNYKELISDTAFGANVASFSKTADPAGYPEAVNSFKNIYEKGASLITYFGHSSATSLDFNLDNPENYNNHHKYPIFVANGCSAGNHFLFEPDRLNTKSTISEKFVLSPERGAVGYLASTHFGVVNYLDLYTNDFYKALGKTRYNQSVGAVITEAIRSSLDSTGSDDYYSRVHAEQYAFHGDPAIMINSSPLPDYVIEKPQVQVTPAFVSVSDSVFAVKVKIYNIGRATGDSVSFQLNREKPDGDIVNLVTKSFSSIKVFDSITVEIPVVGNLEKGINKITATIDYKSSVAELSENNNSVTIEVKISEDEIRPVYPYNYAIVTDPGTKLYASTVNPLNILRDYVMEIDTATLFNSSFKIVKKTTATGGIVEFDPAITFESGLTYYWRVAPANEVDPHWLLSSFVFNRSGFTGSQQGHIYQNLNSELKSISLDSSGKYTYKGKVHNLFITNSIYPTSGVEDGHFSVAVDGSTSIVSACVGSSVIFNVFDPVTFKPTLNTTQPFGAPLACSAGREYNFEYSYATAASRKNAMNFIDAVPAGSYVSARIILDAPYNSFAANWAADTALYGKGNSLYHRLKQNGFKVIDSFYKARTWSFVFKKGDLSFTPAYAMSNGVYDRITLSVNCTTPYTQGTITSPAFGPSKTWKNVIWEGFSAEMGNDVPLVNVYGIKPGKADTLLYSLDSTKHSFDISAVDPAQYPFIKLQMNNKDSVTVTPYQLTNWRLSYDPVAEGAIAPNLYYNIPDSVSATNPDTNSVAGFLKLGVGFKNVSDVDFDSLDVKVTLFDSLQNEYAFPVKKLHPLAGGDTMHINLDLDVSGLGGWYNVFIQVNAANAQPEQFSFNNFLYKKVYIEKATTLPVSLVDFNTVLQKDYVKTSWVVASAMNANRYEVEHSSNGISFNTIGTVTATRQNSYFFNHFNPSVGKNYYRLKMIDNDGSFKFSGVTVVTVEKGIEVTLFPNPVKDLLTIKLNNIDNRLFDVRMLNIYGQQLWHRKVNGAVQVNMQKMAAGTYLVQIDNGNSVNSYKIQKQ
ncbi:MAG: type sorting protein [Segetibacter sp.]|nr:type sorting protein [Segetibacter sp.]